MVMWKQLNLFTKPCKSEDFISIHVLPFPDLQRIHCYTVMWEWDAILVQWISQSFLNERTWSQTNTTNIYRPFSCRQFHHLNPTEGVHWEVEPVYRAILSEFAALTNHILTVEHIYYEIPLGHTSALILNAYRGRLYVEEFSPPHQLFYRVYSEIRSYSPIKPQKPGISHQHMPDENRCSPVCWF